MENQKRFVRSSVHLDELKSKQQKKTHRRTVMYVILFLGATLLFLAVFFLLFFRISEIRIEGNEIYTDEQILSYLTVQTGDNLFSFRAEELANTLRKGLPFAGNIEVKRQLPSTLVIHVKERHEEFSMSVGDEVYLLSGDLLVLGRVGGSEILSGVASLQAGAVERCLVGEKVVFFDTRTSDNFEELYRCLSAYNMMPDIVSIDMTSRFDIQINYANRFSVYLGDIDSMEMKIRFLVGVLEQLRSTDSGKIYLSDPREAAVQLDTTTDPTTPNGNSDVSSG